MIFSHTISQPMILQNILCVIARNEIYINFENVHVLHLISVFKIEIYFYIHDNKL